MQDNTQQNSPYEPIFYQNVFFGQDNIYFDENVSSPQVKTHTQENFLQTGCSTLNMIENLDKHVLEPQDSVMLADTHGNAGSSRDIYIFDCLFDSPKQIYADQISQDTISPTTGVVGSKRSIQQVYNKGIYSNSYTRFSVKRPKHSLSLEELLFDRIIEVEDLFKQIGMANFQTVRAEIHTLPSKEDKRKRLLRYLYEAESVAVTSAQQKKLWRITSHGENNKNSIKDVFIKSLDAKTVLECIDLNSSRSKASYIVFLLVQVYFFGKVEYNSKDCLSHKKYLDLLTQKDKFIFYNDSGTMQLRVWSKEFPSDSLELKIGENIVLLTPESNNGKTQVRLFRVSVPIMPAVVMHVTLTNTDTGFCVIRENYFDNTGEEDRFMSFE